MDGNGFMPLAALLAAAAILPLAAGLALMIRRPRTAFGLLLGIALGVALYFCVQQGKRLYGQWGLPTYGFSIDTGIDAYLDDIRDTMAAAFVLTFAAGLTQRVFWKRFMVASDGIAFGTGLFAALATAFVAWEPVRAFFVQGALIRSAGEIYWTAAALTLLLPMALGFSVMLEKQVAFRRGKCWFAAFFCCWGIGTLLQWGLRLGMEAMVLLGALLISALSMCVYLYHARPELALDSQSCGDDVPEDNLWDEENMDLDVCSEGAMPGEELLSAQAFGEKLSSAKEEKE